MPRQTDTRWDVDHADVRDGLATLRDEGRRYVKSKHVAKAMGLPDESAAATVVGMRLGRLDGDIVTRWNDPVSGSTTWRIQPDDPAEVRANA